MDVVGGGTCNAGHINILHLLLLFSCGLISGPGLDVARPEDGLRAVVETVVLVTFPGQRPAQRYPVLEARQEPGVSPALSLSSSLHALPHT